MKNTYKGSCHCGKVRFEAELDLAAGTGKCNCSICTKLRWWAALIKPEDFRLLSGESELGDYQFGTKQGHHVFCKTCGVHPLAPGYVEEIAGAFYSVNLGCLDDVAPTELAGAPVRHADGRNDDWQSSPAEIRHL
jgi:hypothetical protein